MGVAGRYCRGRAWRWNGGRWSSWAAWLARRNSSSPGLRRLHPPSSSPRCVRRRPGGSRRTARRGRGPRSPMRRLGPIAGAAAVRRGRRGCSRAGAARRAGALRAISTVSRARVISRARTNASSAAAAPSAPANCPAIFRCDAKTHVRSRADGSGRASLRCPGAACPQVRAVGPRVGRADQVRVAPQPPLTHWCDRMLLSTTLPSVKLLSDRLSAYNSPGYRQVCPPVWFSR